MERYLALLRGINVGGRNQIAMPDLRAICAGLGWIDIQSYINSGNLVFGAGGSPAELETELERAIAGRLGLSIPVIVRAGAAWPAYLQGNPFPEASRREPSLVMLGLSKLPPAPGAAQGLQERALNGEQVLQVGDALWIHFPGGSGRSKLSPTLLDRLAGSPVTMRNWRTVQELQRMIQD